MASPEWAVGRERVKLAGVGCTWAHAPLRTKINPACPDPSIHTLPDLAPVSSRAGRYTPGDEGVIVGVAAAKKAPPAAEWGCRSRGGLGIERTVY